MTTFHKMHGLGNDFVILDLDRETLPNTAQIRAWATRHTGIGFDQLLTFKRLSEPDHFAYGIFNADGSQVEQCGNGARCVAGLIHKLQLNQSAELTLHSLGGSIRATILADHNVSINLGVLKHDPLPFDLLLDDRKRQLVAVDVGNPHAVLLLDTDEELSAQERERLSRLIALDRHFPHGVNCGFVKILTPQHIELNVYERGAGATLACGSGACAAAIALLSQQKISSPVTVSQAGGDLVIRWQPNQALQMQGSYCYVFEGTI